MERFKGQVIRLNNVWLQYNVKSAEIKEGYKQKNKHSITHKLQFYNTFQRIIKAAKKQFCTTSSSSKKIKYCVSMRQYLGSPESEK